MLPTSWYIVQYGYYTDHIRTARYIGPFTCHPSAVMVNKSVPNPGVIFSREGRYDLKGPNVLSPDRFWRQRNIRKTDGIQEGF